MLPFLSLILYLLYYRQNFYYVEHLIFAFHLQSFSFIVFAIAIIGMNTFPTWLILTLVGSVLVYLFASMRKVYGQHIGITSFKFLLFTILYFVLLIFMIILTMLTSFLLL